jgi:FlaA1/EpsC-like NDP-sugar epimerase
MVFRLKLYRLLLKVVIYLLPFPAFEIGWSAWSLWAIFLHRPLLYHPGGHFALVVIATFVWAFMAEHYRVTNVDELFRERTGARAACSAITATAVVLLGALYFARDAVFPRGLFVSGILTLLFLTLLAHAAFRLMYRRNIWLGRPSRLLIVGSDQFAVDAAARLRRLSFAPCEVLGYVRLPGQEVQVRNSRIYDFGDIESLCSANEIDEAVIAIHPAQFSQIPSIMKAMEKLSVPARAIVDLGEGVVVRERLFQLGRMQMLDLTTTPADLPDYVLLKRAFDVAFSIFVLTVTAPLMALVALLIRITSQGPIFFTQERVGLNGIPFRMIKFRTMKWSSQIESDTKWTVERDPS